MKKSHWQKHIKGKKEQCSKTFEKYVLVDVTVLAASITVFLNSERNTLKNPSAIICNLNMIIRKKEIEGI